MNGIGRQLEFTYCSEFTNAATWYPRSFGKVLREASAPGIFIAGEFPPLASDERKKEGPAHQSTLNL